MRCRLFTLLSVLLLMCLLGVCSTASAADFTIVINGQPHYVADPTIRATVPGVTIVRNSAALVGNVVTAPVTGNLKTYSYSYSPYFSHRQVAGPPRSSYRVYSYSRGYYTPSYTTVRIRR